MLAPDVQGVVLAEFEASYGRGERQSQQLRQLRPHLARIGVYRVLADQDEVERPFNLQHLGQCPRCGEGVGAGKRRIRHQDAPVCTCCHAPANHVLCRRRPQRYDGALSPCRLCQFDALGEGALAIGVHGKFDAIALQAAIRAERHGFELGYLLDERCHAQGLHGHFLTSGVVQTCAASFRFS